MSLNCLDRVVLLIPDRSRFNHYLSSSSLMSTTILVMPFVFQSVVKDFGLDLCPSTFQSRLRSDEARHFYSRRIQMSQPPKLSIVSNITGTMNLPITGS